MKTVKMRAIRPKCGINRCGKPHYAKGYCQAHYARVWSSRTGKVNMSPKAYGRTFNPIKKGRCSLTGCSYVHFAKGLCQAHYCITRNVATAKDGERACAMKGCDLKHYAKEFCKFHYFMLKEQETNANIKVSSDYEEEAS